MIRSLLLFAILLAAGTGEPLALGDDKKEDQANADLQTLQGTWEGVKLVIDGKVLSDYTKQKPKDAPNITLTYKGHDWAIKVNNNELFSGTSKFDATKTPRQIDVTHTAGPNKGKTFLGIYELQGDEYKACTAPPGKDRPTDFNCKEGSGWTLSISKKQKR